jgi:hypothetical protein
MTKHISMFSGGVGSWAAAMRVRDDIMVPGDELFLVFADVGGRHESKFDGEDADCYRFIQEAAEQIGAPLVWLNEGMNIWEIFRKDRFLGNARLANCSKFLKQRPCRKWLEDNTDPATTVVHVGIDWAETHRVPAIVAAYKPWEARAPLTEPPFLDKADMMAWCRAEGVEPPRMYADGYPHANCGGGCVRAGHGQFKLLLKQDPERYAWWERNEAELREYLHRDGRADVAILRDRSGGGSRPMTLTEFRQRVEGESEQLTLDLDDMGGCGCFTSD